jgi:coenzyme F420-0:L-glutamate ligase
MPPEDDLIGVIDESIPELEEGDVVAVSSKVVAIWQGRCIPIPRGDEERKALKEELIREEADHYLEKDEHFAYSRVFTIYEGIFGSSAGIDESNGDGHFVLLPRNSDAAAHEVRSFLCNKFTIRELGVIVVDSRSAMMRNGTIGIALGHAGFRALNDYRGTKDVFGRQLQFERMNVADCLASAATLIMGEGNECTPLALFRDIPRMNFSEEKSDDFMLLPSVPLQNDVYAQFLKPHDWKQGNKKHDPQ